MFKNKYGELRSGWSIGLLFAAYLASQMLVVMVYGIYLVYEMISSSAEISISTLMYSIPPWIQILVNVFSFGFILLLFKLVYKRPFSQMGFSRQRWGKNFLAGCAMGIVAISLIFLILLLSGQIDIRIIDLNSINFAGIVFALILHLSVGFTEETMFRGYLMTALKTTRNKWLIVLLSAVMFSLMHFANPGYDLLAFINITLIGIAFAYMFIKTGSLWMPIAFHFVWNFVQGSIYGMNVSGTTAASIMETSYLGSNWLTGGAFGPEASILTTAVILVVLAFVHFFVKSPTDPAWTISSDLPFIRTMQYPQSMYMPPMVPGQAPSNPVGPSAYAPPASGQADSRPIDPNWKPPAV